MRIIHGMTDVCCLRPMLVEQCVGYYRGEQTTLNVGCLLCTTKKNVGRSSLTTAD